MINSIQDLITAIGSLIGLLIPFVVGIIVLVIFWGIAKFVYYADNEDERKKGKKIMLWGIIVLFIITSLWGIVSLFQEDLGFNTVSPLTPSEGDPFGPGK